jgi:hypothetical protein
MDVVSEELARKAPIDVLDELRGKAEAVRQCGCSPSYTVCTRLVGYEWHGMLCCGTYHCRAWWRTISLRSRSSCARRYSCLSGCTILLPVPCRVHPPSSTTRSCTHPCTPVIAALAALRPPSPTTAATSRRGWSQAGAAELHEHKVGSHRSHRTVTAQPLRLVARRVAASGRLVAALTVRPLATVGEVAVADSARPIGAHR